MRASILDLRRHMRAILKALDLNETVTLTYRGKDKAVIVPTRKANAQISTKEHPAFGMWKNRKDNGDVEATVREMRKGRRHAV